MQDMKRVALAALILLIPGLVRADEKETMLQALGQFEQAWRSTTPCEVSNNACQTRESWLAQQAARAADRYLTTPDAKESQWRLVAQSVIKYSQARAESVCRKYTSPQSGSGSCRKSVPFNRRSVGARFYRATESHSAKRRKLSRELQSVLGWLIFEVRGPRVRNPPA